MKIDIDRISIIFDIVQGKYRIITSYLKTYLHKTKHLFSIEFNNFIKSVPILKKTNDYILKKNEKYKVITLLNSYISKEFFVNFVLSFCFFYFIFLINQILVMLQHNDVKNLSVKVILTLIILSTPQFLIFTFPFSSITSAAMVVGNLASKNEILAMRSLGLSLKRIYIPFLFMSILAGFGTYYISSVVNPWASSKYKKVYAKVISDMPIMALKPNSVTTLKNISVSVGDVKGGVLNDIIIFDLNDSSSQKLISAPRGELSQTKGNQYIYQLELTNPEMIFTNNKNTKRYSAATAQKLVYYLDMSSMLPNFGEPTSSQVRTKVLLRNIEREKENERKNKIKIKERISTLSYNLAYNMEELTNNDSSSSAQSIIKNVIDNYGNLKAEKSKSHISYRKLYYLTEFHKRIALSFACIVLALLAFPLSFFKVKYGKLIGFAMSMIISVLYWGFLFFSQISSMTKIGMPVILKMWSANIFFIIVALLLLWRLNKA